MALPQAKLDATEARLAGVRAPAGAAWAETARARALTRVRSMGLPARRDEYWKYTRPDTLVTPDTPEAALPVDDEIPLFDDVDGLRLVFVDGVFDADASDPLKGVGLTVERLADVTRNDIHWAGTLYGALETRGQSHIERPLAALNTALADHGVVIRATAKVERP
ncbi:MAG: Fe-S cluster assembly protein SufD, partial [Pseudomonadota bacterium]